MTDAAVRVIYKILIAGIDGAGKRSFLNTIATPLPEHEGHIIGYASEMLNRSNLGVIDYEEGALYLVTVGAWPFDYDYLWEALAENCLGCIILVDSHTPQTFDKARVLVETYAAYIPRPYVIAANFQDHPDAWDVEALRTTLNVPSVIPIVPCNARDRESVKTVLLTLIDFVMQDPNAWRFYRGQF